MLTSAHHNEKTPLLTASLGSPPSSTKKTGDKKVASSDDKWHEPSLIVALLKTYGAIYSVSLLWKFISDVLQFVSPVLLGYELYM